MTTNLAVVGGVLAILVAFIIYGISELNREDREAAERDSGWHDEGRK